MLTDSLVVRKYPDCGLDPSNFTFGKRPEAVCLFTLRLTDDISARQPIHHPPDEVVRHALHRGSPNDSLPFPASSPTKAAPDNQLAAADKTSSPKKAAPVVEPTPPPPAADITASATLAEGRGEFTITLDSSQPISSHAAHKRVVCCRVCSRLIACHLIRLIPRSPQQANARAKRQLASKTKSIWRRLERKSLASPKHKAHQTLQQRWQHRKQKAKAERASSTPTQSGKTSNRVRRHCSERSQRSRSHRRRSRSSRRSPSRRFRRHLL